VLIVHVHVCVKPDNVEDFKRATVENASSSIKEPGIARFDVLQEADDPAKFILVEAYRNSQAPARHKKTDHYALWRDTVEPMMEEPRRSEKYLNTFPKDRDW